MAQFSDPSRVALDAEGTIFVSDNHDRLRMGSAARDVPMLFLSSVLLANGQVQIGFITPTGWGSAFQLLEANRPDGPWRTNDTAAISILSPGASYRFTVSYDAVPARFYRVQSQ